MTQPTYEPTIYRRGLTLIWLPCVVGIITFAMLTQLWNQAMRFSANERDETKIVGHLNLAMRAWGAVSDHYSKSFVSGLTLKEYAIKEARDKLEFELKEAENLANGERTAESNQDLQVTGKIRELFAREMRTYRDVSKIRESILDSIGLGSGAGEQPDLSIKKTIEAAYRNFCAVKIMGRDTIVARWESLKSVRVVQTDTLSRFAWVTALAMVANVISSCVLAWIVSAPIAKRMRILFDSSEKFLHGDLDIVPLSTSDEFSYLQNVLLQSFKSVFAAAEHRQMILAMVAHDMRTPLMSARANLNLMEEYADGFSEDALDVLMKVYDRLQKVVDTVEKILTSEESFSEHSQRVNDQPIQSTRKIFIRPRLFQQILALVIFPVVIQISLLAAIGLQASKVWGATQEARHGTDMVMVTNVTLLDTLIATCEQGIATLTDESSAGALSNHYFDEAIDQCKQMIAISANEPLAKEYSSLYLIELEQVRKGVMDIHASPTVATSLKHLKRIGSLHDNSVIGKRARQMELVWLDSNRKQLLESSKRIKAITANTKAFIYVSLVLYLASELLVLLTFGLIIDKRVKLVIEKASRVGKSSLKDLPTMTYSGDEIADLDSILTRADAKLTEAKARRSEMLTYLSKEMSEPLIEAIQTEEKFATMTKDSLSDKCAGYLLNSQNSITQVLNVLNDLLAIETMTDGDMKLKRSAFKSTELIEKGVSAVAGLAKVKNIAITSESERGEIKADQALLVRVLINLLANAVKFSPVGSSVQVTGKFEGNSFRVDVIDEGPGVTAGESSMIFEPRYRSAVQADEQGHGLGLAIAKLLVEAHGGSIACGGREGKGSDFWFTIPVG